MPPRTGRPYVLRDENGVVLGERTTRLSAEKLSKSLKPKGYKFFYSHTVGGVTTMQYRRETSKDVFGYVKHTIKQESKEQE